MYHQLPYAKRAPLYKPTNHRVWYSMFHFETEAMFHFTHNMYSYSHAILRRYPLRQFACDLALHTTCNKASSPAVAVDERFDRQGLVGARPTWAHMADASRGEVNKWDVSGPRGYVRAWSNWESGAIANMSRNEVRLFNLLCSFCRLLSNV